MSEPFAVQVKKDLEDMKNVLGNFTPNRELEYASYPIDGTLVVLTPGTYLFDFKNADIWKDGIPFANMSMRMVGKANFFILVYDKVIAAALTESRGFIRFEPGWSPCGLRGFGTHKLFVKITVNTQFFIFAATAPILSAPPSLMSAGVTDKMIIWDGTTIVGVTAGGALKVTIPAIEVAEIDRIKALWDGAADQNPIGVDGLYPMGIDRISRPVHSSTIAPLLAPAGVYTSVSVDALKYSRITGSLYSDVNGTLYVEQSPDNVNWDVVEPIPYVGATTIGFTIALVAQYVRLRYVTGPAQTVFRLYGWLKVLGES